ncbi:C40 family peptidase [Actinophytocola sp.]|uniref:C40 family peptidase n=1 Tax=Actinophytocola sp. TaxID=1872138 RepID=UPI002ED9255E
MRGVLASLGGVVVLTATLLVAPTQVAAQPTTVAGLLAHYQDLSREAERVNEELLIVQENLTTQQQASAKATRAAEAAKAVADAAREKVNAARNLDQVAEALSSRGDLDALSAFASSTSPDDLLGKLEAVSLAQHLTGGPQQGDTALAEAEAAEARAAAASAAATAAETKVADGAAEVQKRRTGLNRQITEVQAALDHLTPDQRSLLAGVEDYGSDVVIPNGNIGGMLQFALGQLGKPYLWGAIGPDSYDCSGLVQTAFRAAGVALPRVSRQQATVGQAVSRADVRAGDLIFYYQPVHHVAIAVDNVRAVHAPSFGETVKIGGIDAIGPITVIRRVVG